MLASSAGDYTVLGGFPVPAFMRFAAAVTLGLVLASPSAAEQKIARKNLPPKVEAAVKAEEAKGAAITGLSKEMNGGKTVYEIETTMNGRSRDLILSADGEILELEEAVDITDVPEAAAHALGAHGTIVSIERVTKGSVVTYEARVKRNGKTSERQVRADGSAVK